MTDLFDRDSYPGNPKILFIGLGSSTHTHSWIGLLSDMKFNVRLFAMPGSLPPPDWPVKTYISLREIKKSTPIRQYVYSGLKGRLERIYSKNAAKIGLQPTGEPDAWLARIIKQWKPDIIHTLGMFDGQGGLFYYEAREKYELQGIGKWILQTRGGSDLALRRHDPKIAPVIQKMFNNCYQIISDNLANIRYVQELGSAPEKFASIVPVPGTGGVEIAVHSEDMLPPSQRERIILWPKAYESRWSKALPVIEAIQLAWHKIQPCEIYMLDIRADVHEWLLAMPHEIRDHCRVFDRISHKETLLLMRRARVMLAPSLIDGVPNSLYEAMANGAFSIISPLETITPVVKSDENVLFARNLYPDEIANALVRAMNNDKLVDKAAKKNMKLVAEIANRQKIKRKVENFYRGLVDKSA